MRRGGFAFVASSSLAIAACSAPNVQVRALPDPASKLNQGGDELATARTMLAMGNVGLALEGFRKLEISQPTNPEVYAGIAQCYEAMGRYDLEQSNYERALAYAPRDPTLLAEFASSLERQGDRDRAASVRAEIAQERAPLSSPAARISKADPGSKNPQLASAAAQVPHVGSITVKLPPVRPMTEALAKAPPPPTAARVNVVEVAMPASALTSPPLTKEQTEANAAPLPKPNLTAVPVQIRAAQTSQMQIAELSFPDISMPLAPPQPQTTVAVKSKEQTEANAAPLPKPSLTAVPVQIRAAQQSQMQIAELGLPDISMPLASPQPQTTVAVKPKTPIHLAHPAVDLPMRRAASRPLAVPKSALPSTSRLVAQLAAMEPVLQPPEPRQPFKEEAIKPRDPEARLKEDATETGPRLERLSLGEVALVTTHAPLWKRQVASNAPSGPLVRWLPIATAEARPPIQLLNAARTRGLAAWTRMALVTRGWRRIDIGDYGEVRQRSLVLYSGDHAPLARRLAAQLSCKTVKVNGKPAVIVLLGRDAASRKAASLRS